MLHNSKLRIGPGTGWPRLLALLVVGLALLTSSCKDAVGDIGVGLPNAQANTGAYLVDTLTIRTSTVLRDSVVTSNSSYLMVGRTVDPVLGTLTARSAFRLGLNSSFTPDISMQFDSLVLVLTADSYRYGDTTRTQDLVQVHQLTNALPDIVPLFAAPRFTPLTYSSTLLNYGPPLRIRARPTLTTLRVRLKQQLGEQLMAAAKAGNLTNQNQLNAVLKDMVITGDDNDNGALVRFNLNASTTALNLYYHDPVDVTTALAVGFDVASGQRHVFQISRSAAPVTLPVVSLDQAPASRTGERTFVEGVLGLQTKLEFPYLQDLLTFGANATITSAQLVASVPMGTLSPGIPSPPALTVSTVDARNQPIGTYVGNVPYLTATSALSGLDQGTYEWSILSYCQAVLSRTIPNNGLLLSANPAELPNRVVLGSPRNINNKMQLRVYLIQLN